jgi:hypothetical protein
MLQTHDYILGFIPALHPYDKMSHHLETINVKYLFPYVEIYWSI